MILAFLVALGTVALTAAPPPAGQQPKEPPAVLAPELVGGSWLNLPPGTKLTLAARRGKVTIVHFWTYGCINCRRNLPFYATWQKRYAARGVLVIGIHSPETTGEAKLENVTRKVKEFGITYPVLVDSERQNWNRWGQRVWPAICLVDKQGRARYGWEGELEYKGAGGAGRMSQHIEALLKE
ncbi:MAG TPA: redoxin domain-containing protein [Verrucomicrobiota bacterium]|nr:redoxin domain-containing protein [Verrucomicrobiota bacterium]